LPCRVGIFAGEFAVQKYLRRRVSVGHPEGNRAVGDGAKVVQTNDVFIFCPDDRYHAMLHEAIRRPVG